jgi:hypothetical protein
MLLCLFWKIFIEIINLFENLGQLRLLFGKGAIA